MGRRSCRRGLPVLPVHFPISPSDMSDTSNATDMPDTSDSSAASRRSPLRDRVETIIFGNDTPAGHFFDVVLIIAILLSIVAVMLDSVVAISEQWGAELAILEWIFTILFTVEYVLRLYSARSTIGYARSFFGMVDLLAILPTFISILFPPGRFLLTIRVLRVLRVFRVLKLVRFLGAEDVLFTALRAGRRKIVVFMLAVSTIVVIVGSLMYVIEGVDAGFTSIPRGVYWAIVTVTTVGYGDIAPLTPLGQMLAVLLMFTGYAIIAVPTGIVGVEVGRFYGGGQPTWKVCGACGRGSGTPNVSYCGFCGEPLQTKNFGESG